jgi:hypothetical protein
MLHCFWMLPIICSGAWVSLCTTTFGSYLASEVQSSDRKPTDQARDAHAVVKTQLALVQREYALLLQRELARVNALLRSRGLAPVSLAVP